jgi:hypothetical protein
LPAVEKFFDLFRDRPRTGRMNPVDGCSGAAEALEEQSVPAVEWRDPIDRPIGGTIMTCSAAFLFDQLR